MNITFSIITATYNHQEFILDCIKSVQAQTYSNWEMIIVNDGSTDKTSQIASEHIKSDPRIKLYDRENVGIFRLKETYNYALEQCNGDYICILEGDDVYEPNKLERQLKAFTDYPDIVLAWGKAYKKHVNLSDFGVLPDISDPLVIKHFSNSPTGNILNVLYLRNYIPALTIAIPKNILKEIGGFIQSHNLPVVDFPTVLALTVKGPFYYDDAPLGSWRVTAEQITKTYPIHITQGVYAAIIDHYESLPNSIKQHLFVSKEAIARTYQNTIHITLARSGRYKLIRKEFKSARKDYLKAIFFKGTKNHMWRIRSIVGFLLSYLRTDVEGLAKVLGKDSYGKRQN